MTLWRALRRYLKGDGLVFSGYMAFLTLLGTLPALAVLFWLSQQSVVIRSADAALRDFLYSNLFPDAAKQVVGVIDKLRANARGLGQTGVIIVAADLVLKALTLNAAVDRIWGPARRSIWGYVRGVMAVLIALPLVVGALAWLLQFLESFCIHLVPSAKSMLNHIFDPVQIAAPLVLGLTLVYRWVPVKVHTWRSPLLAAVCVTALVVAARFVIGHYLAQAQQLKSLYGAFVAFPLLMITVFVIWALVLYGAALVAEGFGATWRWRGATKSRPKAKESRSDKPSV